MSIRKRLAPQNLKFTGCLDLAPKRNQAPLHFRMFDLETLFAGIAFIIGNIAITFATVTYAKYLSEKKKRRKDEYDLLKNALLAMALSMVFSNEIDNGNYNYDEYDGSMLPPLSGSDLVNAYMSYLVDSRNPHIHSKYNAIQRFLHSNILTERDQEGFIEAYISILKLIMKGIYKNGEPVSDEKEEKDLIDDSDADKEKLE